MGMRDDDNHDYEPVDDAPSPNNDDAPTDDHGTGYHLDAGPNDLD